MSKVKGFTLIELLITVTILVIVSTIGFTAYSNAQVSARDSRRKNDLKAIAVALEVYHQKNGIYPAATGTRIYSTSSSTPWITSLDTNYINVLPKDPINTSGCTFTNPPSALCYTYAYESETFGGSVNIWDQVLGDATDCPTALGQWYFLATMLENPNDPDINSLKHYKTCGGVDTATEPSSWGGSYANAYIITP